MTLFMLRHGIAEDTPPGESDRDRRLSDEGRRKLERQLPFFRSLGVRLDAVLSSPYPRALETAEIVAPAFGCTVEKAPLLRPGCTLDDVAETLSAHARTDRCMIVGHQPDLGYILHVLTGAHASIRKGMLAVVETPALRPSAGILSGLYDPDVMTGGETIS